MDKEEKDAIIQRLWVEHGIKIPSDKNTLPDGWKEYSPNAIERYAIAHYQRIVVNDERGKIGLNIYVYETGSYELDIQIPDQFSITGMTINIKEFGYPNGPIDFDTCNRHGQTIISKLAYIDKWVVKN